MLCKNIREHPLTILISFILFYWYLYCILSENNKTCFTQTYQINRAFYVQPYVVHAEKIEHKYRDCFKTKLRIDCSDSRLSLQDKGFNIPRLNTEWLKAAPGLLRNGSATARLDHLCSMLLTLLRVAQQS